MPRKSAPGWDPVLAQLRADLAQMLRESGLPDADDGYPDEVPPNPVSDEFIRMFIESPGQSINMTWARAVAFVESLPPCD